MAEVIHLPERKPIPPKQVTALHAGQRYTITFDPNAPLHERWMWRVDFTRVYSFIGACASIDLASRQARRRIDRMSMRTQREEEHE